ncbi:MAG: hypothetical protein IKY23_10365 [Lachnospiraceae bacterium]|nr:hypothetical protein [Lachnospiraceae bacterium]
MKVVVFGRENDDYFKEARQLVNLCSCKKGDMLVFQDVDLVFGYTYDLGIIVGKEAANALSNRLVPALKRRSVCLCRENEYVDESYTHQLMCANNEVLSVLSELLDIFCGDTLISIESEDFLDAVDKDAYCIVSEGTIESISFDNYRESNPRDEVVLVFMRGNFTLGEVGELYNKIIKEDDPVWGYCYSIEDTVNTLTVWSR